MTIREIYKALLIELNKVQAPSILLEDFNYYINKVIQQYTNKKYNLCDINQQNMDDLGVLRESKILIPEKYFDKDNISDISSLYKGVYEVQLPEDYLHLLNCICLYKIYDQCHKDGYIIEYPAIKLTSNSIGQVLKDYYNRPSIKKPYYFIYNTKDSLNNIFSNNIQENTVNPEVIKLTTKKPILYNQQNSGKMKMQIRCGSKDTTHNLFGVLINYLRVPKKISLTQEQLDLIQDTSEVMEFQDYVCREIINELVTAILENTSNPRLETYLPVSQSIANPTQAIEKSKK